MNIGKTICGRLLPTIPKLNKRRQCFNAISDRKDPKKSGTPNRVWQESMKKQISQLIAMGLTTATIMGGVMPVYAADPTTASAALDNTKEVYTTTDAAGTGSWTTGDGKISLTYDTTNGLWEDSQGTNHANGTYVVRIPTAIKYENMHVGKVATSNDYDVIVEGVLASGKKVSVTAQTGQPVTFQGTVANANDKITETTSMKGTDTANEKNAYSDTNKRTFTAEQVSVMDDSGKVSGKTVQDNISMNGFAYSAGTYTGTVQYSSALA